MEWTISSVGLTSILALPACIHQNEQHETFRNISTPRMLHKRVMLTADMSHGSARQRRPGQSDSKEPMSVLEAWFRSLLAVTVT